MNYNNISQRVGTNLLHYRSNYIFIAAVVMLVKIIFSPLLLISLCICAGFFYYAFVIHNEPFTFGENMRVDGSSKAVVCGVVSFIFLALTGSLENMVWGALTVILLCGFHAILRPRSIAARVNYVYEDTKLSFSGSRSSTDPENPSYSSSDSYPLNGSGIGYEDAAIRKRGAGGKNSTSNVSSVPYAVDPSYNSSKHD
jgi:hypothetical protein